MAKAAQSTMHAVSVGDLYEVTDGPGSSYADAELDSDAEVAELLGFARDAEQYPLVREPGYLKSRRAAFDMPGCDEDVDSDDWLQAEAEERLWNAR